MTEEKVAVYVNSVGMQYEQFYSDAIMVSPVVRVPANINISVTLESINLSATIDLEVDQASVVTTHGVPDYKATARRAIKYLASGIIDER